MLSLSGAEKPVMSILLAVAIRVAPMHGNLALHVEQNGARQPLSGDLSLPVFLATWRKLSDCDDKPTAGWMPTQFLGNARSRGLYER